MPLLFPDEGPFLLWASSMARLGDRMHVRRCSLLVRIACHHPFRVSSVFFVSNLARPSDRKLAQTTASLLHDPDALVREKGTSSCAYGRRTSYGSGSFLTRTLHGSCMNLAWSCSICVPKPSIASSGGTSDKVQDGTGRSCDVNVIDGVAVHNLLKGVFISHVEMSLRRFGWIFSSR